jgi:hypothetical protein
VLTPVRDYTAAERLLHRLALSLPIVGELSFGLENAVFGHELAPRDSVYVTGLARAGTTALTRALYKTGRFASLTYADMPFVLAPNLWSKVFRSSGWDETPRERAHGDGIDVSISSPEAFEEVFWRVNMDLPYVAATELVQHAVPEEVVGRLRRYQSLVCLRYQRGRYLAKNNNHVLRIGSLAASMPESTFLVVFREPMEHSDSLLRQHVRFRGSDRFTRQYMTWLAHHEFGAVHRPFRFVGQGAAIGSPEERAYWLQRWIDAYSHLLPILQQARPNVFGVSHRRLCEEGEYRRSLFDRLGLPDPGPVFARRRDVTDSSGLSPASLARASEVHAALEAVR